MKKIDWLAAFLIIAMGLSCMAVSATRLGTTPLSFGSTLIRLCLWVGVPIIGLAAIYMYLKRKR